MSWFSPEALAGLGTSQTRSTRFAETQPWFPFLSKVGCGFIATTGIPPAYYVSGGSDPDLTPLQCMDKAMLAYNRDLSTRAQCADSSSSAAVLSKCAAMGLPPPAAQTVEQVPPPAPPPTPVSYAAPPPLRPLTYVPRMHYMALPTVSLLPEVAPSPETKKKVPAVAWVVGLGLAKALLFS